LTYAQKPLWEEDKNRRAVRGCSLSHLLAVRSLLSQTESVLVFEDDAVPFEEGIAEWETAKTHIPNDAGIVLLGGETEEYGPPDEHGFRLVYPKFWGTQAVLYTEKLINTTFLLDAYEILASQNVGASQNYNGLCFESVLLQ
jgi:GR25 family glycosyltransferase involved in LPS biosynthesis